MAERQETSRPVKTALHQAVLDGRLKQVKILVEKHGVNVDSRDLYGRTPMMLACVLDHVEYGYRMTSLFLRAGAYPNVKDKMGRTVLTYACLKGRERLVRRLLKEDTIELNSADNDGNTALIHASVAGQPDIVSLLIDQYSRFSLSVDLRNKLGYTALLMACKYGHYMCANMLLTKGNASPALRDNEFYLNALEWTNKTDDLQANYTRQRSITLPSIPSAPYVPSFSRETTMYGSLVEPVCFHIKPQYDPLGLEQQRMPNLFREQGRPFDLGTSTKNVLLKNMERTMTVHKTSRSGPVPSSRPFSTSTNVSSPTRTRVESSLSRVTGRDISASMQRPPQPATPALIAFSRRSKTRIADNLYIFKLYSEQYDPYLAGHLTTESLDTLALPKAVKKKAITIQSPVVEA